MRRTVLGLLSGTLIACSAGPPTPIAIDTSADVCAHCRMTIVSTSTAAQIVAPGTEPVLFDDLGCLVDYLSRAALGPDATVFVADHRTGDWATAATAVFTRTTLATPMASGLIAHASGASRDLDAAAKGGTPVPAGSLLP